MKDEIKIITLNQFLDIECKSCFVCGYEKYNEFYFKDSLYRICGKCLKKDNIIQFFKERGMKWVC